jgi:hypothetical protein
MLYVCNLRGARLEGEDRPEIEGPGIRDIAAEIILEANDCIRIQHFYCAAKVTLTISQTVSTIAL